MMMSFVKTDAFDLYSYSNQSPLAMAPPDTSTGMFEASSSSSFFF